MTRIIAVLFTLLVTFTTSAQVVQPVYVRPSKGALVPAIVDAGAANVTSAIYDMTAFESALIYVSCVPGPCGNTTIDTLEALSKTGPESLILDPNRRYIPLAGLNSVTYSVSELPPYIRFKIFTIQAGQVVSVSFVPLPFNQRTEVSGSYQIATVPGGNFYPVPVAGLDNGNRIAPIKTDSYGRVAVATVTTNVQTSAVAVNNVATAVNTPNPTICSVYVVNTDTTDAYCGPSFVTAADGTPLNAAAAAGKAGGSYKFENYGGDVYCITAAGSTTVRVIKQPCP